MDLQAILRQYWPSLCQQNNSLTREHYSAANAMLGCRTEQYGTLELACRECSTVSQRHLACGHRFCHQCQHHNTEQWLARQYNKLLPVTYYMATFTLPYELRALTKKHAKVVFSALFDCASATLKAFALNHPTLKGELGLTAVLHTHTRRLDYHPHIHVVIPGGAFDRTRREWRKANSQYLFNGNALAIVFRAKLLAALQKLGLTLPWTPPTWVVQCQLVGYGKSALKYLARYLYRGVIREDRIIGNSDGKITFEYTDSKTQKTQTRTLTGEAFLELLLQHVLPTGFRRVRDYGFLHGNAKRILSQLQWCCQVNQAQTTPPTRQPFCCPSCSQHMVIVGLLRRKPKPG